ncbi:DNA polymerase IV [Flavobacterium sp.]|uniref:DNA polymerase IV n=1 Tax=Flavobacterium sp. TaxID=239 RepID=UPI003B9A73BB
MRKIIHIDMDAFYASVEQLDFPDLRGKPIAVGGNEVRGVVSAASYEARKFGVRSAISGVLAKRLCPQLIFVPLRFDRYREISAKIREIFFQYTDLVEPLSLDEAYLDVTQNKVNQGSATLLATEIRQRIFQETQLTASAGISINKFLAKVASDYNKPNGQFTIAPEQVETFLEELPIGKFYGVGKVTRDKMYSHQIFTGKDLKAKSAEFLETHFGKPGLDYYKIVRGIHESPVMPERTQKSVATEHTFETNLTSELFMIDKLEVIAKELSARLKKHDLAGKTVTLKIKYSDFTLQTRSKTGVHFLSTAGALFQVAKELLYQERLRDSVRLLGISVSNLNVDQKKSVGIQLKFDF